MAEADVRAAGRAVHRPAVGGHRVDVVEQQRAGRDRVEVGAQVEQDRDRAQRAEHAAGTERVAHALLDAVAPWNLDVAAVGVEAALLEGGHDVARARDRLAAVERRLDPRGQAARRDERVDELRGGPQPARVDVHERDHAVAQRLGEQEVRAQVAREDGAPRADKGDPGH